ncbi:predicted protein [Uncinocarpus reesii 1704]|uniref:Major facilitator superfamily (MFS) profile domain-containing protein n=1 Tax=Uncinocarpus reesii (strain UAMH 1704) TaxID=336963 RepID=C4JS12_UNCRE|nr:uncharacterized protein UREG_05251 [Uncinocarpus reesii 1704]EEP80409.1 predicted protein [Uncinocarpus reesii 1704]
MDPWRPALVPIAPRTHIDSVEVIPSMTATKIGTQQFRSLQEAIRFIENHPIQQRYGLQMQLMQGLMSANQLLEDIITEFYDYVKSSSAWEQVGQVQFASDFQESKTVMERALKRRSDISCIKDRLISNWGTERIEGLWRHIKSLWTAQRARRALNKFSDWDAFVHRLNVSILLRLNAEGAGHRRTVNVIPGDFDYAFDNASNDIAPVNLQDIRRLGLDVGPQGILQQLNLPENYKQPVQRQIRSNRPEVVPQLILEQLNLSENYNQPGRLDVGPQVILQQLNLPENYNQPVQRQTRSNASGAPERMELAEDQATDALQSVSRPRGNKWRLLSCCLMNFGNGLNDSAPGALIPYMEKEYDIGYAVVSLVFVTNALGFILAAPCTDFLEARLGRARSYALSLSMVAVAHAVMIAKPPFPVVMTCFFFIGFGLTVNLALNNVFCANLVNNTAALGGLHGGYGVGGTVSPLAATAITASGIRWSMFYIIPLAVGLANIAFSAWSFREYVEDQSAAGDQRTSSERPAQSAQLSRGRLLKEAIKNRVTLLGALFIFAYQGAEVSISGWAVSFLVSYRGADIAKVGYVSTGFWAGITVGRFLLSHPAQKLGRKTSVVGLIIGSAAFQLVVWLVPNVIGDAIALAIVGLLLGPVYPCAAAVFSTLLPRGIQLSSLGFISAMGSSGGAVAPFFTGLLAQKLGTVVLHPICIALHVNIAGGVRSFRSQVMTIGKHAAIPIGW